MIDGGGASDTLPARSPGIVDEDTSLLDVVPRNSADLELPIGIDTGSRCRIVRVRFGKVS
jgi:hypothetical protein